jgi:hypothetical protein
MEDIKNRIVHCAEFKRSEWLTRIFFLDELAFRRGLSGVLGKPPYAA